MATPLATLKARRADALNQLEAVVASADRKGSLTADEEARGAKAARTIEKLDKKIAYRDQVRSGTVVVRNEPTTYGKGSPNSYVADLVRASAPAWPGHHEANTRLQKHAKEMAVEANSGKAKTRRHIASQTRELRRSPGPETRAMDTTSASGGSFVTPVYLEGEYAPFRQFGRVFVDQCRKEPLPEYGMTVYLPAVNAAAGVATQSTQGSAVTESDPTSGYLSANLTTLAGQVTVSQQLLDRAGPNFRFDQLIFDQLRRDYNFGFNQAVVTAALTGAQTPTIPTTALTISQFYSDVAAAKAAIATASGVVLPATHLFAPQATWEWLASRTDANGHALIVPNANGPFNALAAGDGASVAEGDTGYKVLGLNVFADGGIPESSGNAQVVVAHMPEVWVFEGDLVPRVIPQTLAQNLQVLVQLYSYSAVIVRYPHAVATLTGSAYPATPTF